MRHRLRKQNADDERDDERETKKRRTTRVGFNARLNPQEEMNVDVDDEVHDTGDERWDDGEVSFLVRPEEAAEAHDAEGLRERSHSGEKDAGEARRHKENG